MCFFRYIYIHIFFQSFDRAIEWCLWTSFRSIGRRRCDSSVRMSKAFSRRILYGGGARRACADGASRHDRITRDRANKERWFTETLKYRDFFNAHYYWMHAAGHERPTVSMKIRDTQRGFASSAGIRTACVRTVQPQLNDLYHRWDSEISTDRAAVPYASTTNGTITHQYICIEHPTKGTNF